MNLFYKIDTHMILVVSFELNETLLSIPLELGQKLHCIS